jgi:hypothetical protein
MFYRVLHSIDSGSGRQAMLLWQIEVNRVIEGQLYISFRHNQIFIPQHSLFTFDVHMSQPEDDRISHGANDWHRTEHLYV